MAQKKISDLSLRSDFDATVNLAGDDASQTWRVTGAQIKAYIQAQIADLMRQSRDLQNLGLAASVSGNALTVALKTYLGASDPSSSAPVTIGFRGSTASNGDFSLVQAIAATSVVISSGSTLGMSSGIAGTIYVYALNNGGTIELAISRKLYDEGSLVTTTAEGGAGAADSATVIYSTTARTSKAIRLIGRLVATEATAGTWASAPTEVSLQPNLLRVGDLLTTGVADSGIAGSIGEYLEAKNSGDNAFGATGAYSDAGSLSLTAGDWDVSFMMGAIPLSVGAFPYCAAGISTTTGNSATGLVTGENQLFAFHNIVSNTPYFGIAVPNYRMSLAATTTVYGKVMASYSGGSGAPGFNYRLSARRVR